MPPPLAALITVALIFFLFWHERREKPNVTGALWIPIIWLLIIGSRPVSVWLMGLSPDDAQALEEGSPLDRFIYLALITAGIVALTKRQIAFVQFVHANTWLILFLAYCLLSSIVWSEVPLIAIKRWFKALGHPIMVLIVLTEPDRMEAVSRLLKRCAYILLLISVLFTKYYHELGRGYDEWTGRVFHVGVTTNKNALGYLCMVFGFFFFWQLLKAFALPRGPNRQYEAALSGGFLAIILWLLSTIDAKTASVTFLVSALTVVLLGTKWIVKRRIGTYVLVFALAALSADYFLDAYSQLIRLLGRNATLTDRTEMWSTLLKFDINPLFGAGFESFWLGDRLDQIWAQYWWKPNQAHNGYIETYLNLGIVGVLLLAALLFATFLKIRWALLREPDMGRFRLPLFFAILLFNYTDAIFKAVHPLWFIFYLVAIDYPETRSQAAVRLSKPSGSKQRPNLVPLRMSA